MAAETRVKNSASTSGVLAQVASRARVSTGTVSRVFNNSSLIPTETRSRVLTAARELGFRPRVGVRSKQIAIVTEPPHRTVMGGYVNTLTQHICYALSRVDAGITMITEDRIGNLADCWFDGVIGIAWEDRTIEILKKIHNIPMVWFSDNQSSWCHTVFTNCYENGKLAGQYLLGKGHRRIAVIHDPDYTGCGRAEGIRIAIREGGFEQDGFLLALSSSEPLHLSVKRLIDNGCTAVWVPGEDMRALEVNWLLQELSGKRVPEDISLLGSENPGISEFQRPSLSTISIPLHDMAEIAVDLVMEGECNILRKVEIPAKLIERNSVMSLK